MFSIAESGFFMSFSVFDLTFKAGETAGLSLLIGSGFFL